MSFFIDDTDPAFFSHEEHAYPPPIPDIPALVLSGMRTDIGELIQRVAALEDRNDRELEVSVTRQGQNFQALVYSDGEYRTALFDNRLEAMEWTTAVCRILGTA